MRLGLPSLAFERESMPDIRGLGVDTSKIPAVNPVSIKKMPQDVYINQAEPGTPTWWQAAGYNSVEDAIKSGNFTFDMNKGWQLKPDAITPAMEKAVMGAASGEASGLGPLGTSGVSMMEDEPITLVSDESPMSPSYSSETPSFEAMKEAVKAALAATKQPVEKDLVRDDPVSGVATGYSGDGFEDQLEEEPSNVDVVKEIIDSIGTTATEESEIDKAVAAAVAAAEGDKTVVEKELAKSDPVQAAVDAAVGNGQPTTDKNPFGTYSGEGFIPPPKGSMVTQAFVNYYNPSTGETYMTPTGGYTAPEGWISGTKEDYERNKEYYDNILAGGKPDLSLLPGAGTETETGTGTGTETQQPDFMTQLQELIAQMQAEQTAAAEQAAAAEAERQKQAAAMTQNYMVGQPAVGYNPYQSGQYQSDPYGAAGVPDMGGITSIPVPAAYTPNPYLIGGMT
tara:strand:- start:1271 stop:2629 length:1359 start_codon:yes stop_codon:yes gene_type:complete